MLMQFHKQQQKNILWNGMERNGPVQKHSQNALPGISLNYNSVNSTPWHSIQLPLGCGQFSSIPTHEFEGSRFSQTLMDDSNQIELLHIKAYKGLTTTLHP